jgi:uncharacterized FAD-dependent dehydrogenase
MKLYEVERETWVRVLEEAGVPMEALEIGAGDKVLFHHIDGMYSFCHNEDGRIVHLSASTEVEVIE